MKELLYIVVPGRRCLQCEAVSVPSGSEEERAILWLKCFFTSTETAGVGLLGTGAQDGHLDFHIAPELCR